MRLIIATLVALSVTFSSFAITGADRPDPVVTLEKVGSNKYQLKFLTAPEGKVVVSIKNEGNSVVYKDVIDADKVFSRNYDLNKLSLGTYRFQITDSEAGKLKDFEVHLAAETKLDSFKADTKVVNYNTVALFVRNLDSKEKTVRIYDGQEIIHEETFSDVAFGKKFNFKNLRSVKNVSFEIIDGDGFGKFVSVR